MNPRSEIELCVDILRCIDSGRQKPTHVMYGVNVSWTRSREIINYLIEREFIEEKPYKTKRTKRRRVVYSLTPAAQKLLRQVADLEKVLGKTLGKPEYYL